MTALEILKAARAKIEKPENWTHGAFAVDESGNEVREDDPKACRFCAAGALRAAGWYEVGRDYSLAYAALSGVTSGITSFNDTATHEKVLRAFDEAIQLLEQARA